MKLFRKIISLVLVIAFFNVVIEKALHEFFEHHTDVHSCIDVGSIHFHNHEFSHSDFICDFNFSTTLLNDVVFFTKGITPYIERESIIKNLCLVKDSCLNSIQLRGPPSLNS